MTTISEEYRELNRKLHEDRPDYGANGHRYAPVVLKHWRAVAAAGVLDYGCGKGTLGVILRQNGVAVHDYDPAIAGKDAAPEAADLVYCGDVAEHIEPECLDAFLDDLQRVTVKRLILIVATRPASKTLADGRNAHLIVQPLDWWLPKLTARFHMVEIAGNAGEFVFIGDAK